MSSSHAWARPVVDCLAREAGVDPAYVTKVVFDGGEVKPAEVFRIEIEGREQTGITLRVKVQHPTAGDVKSGEQQRKGGVIE